MALSTALVAILTGTAVMFGQPALAQEPGFFERIFGNSDRLTSPSVPQTSDVEDRGERAAVVQNRVAQGAGGDTTMRIDRLEAQIRQLTGAIEQLQYRNQQLEAQLRRVLDEDPRSVGGRPVAQARPAANPAAAMPPATMPPAASSPVASAPVAVPSTTGAMPGRRGDAFDPSQNPGAPGAPRPMGTTVPSAPLQQFPEGDEAVGAPGGRHAGAPLDLSTLTGSVSDPAGRGADQQPAPRGPGTQMATLPPSDNPRDHYDFAYGYVLRKDYALAEDGFRNFLRRFPSDRLVPEAQYWLGESLFQRQRYRDAAETFLTVSTKYESAAKAPDALLRLGQSLAALGEREAACASFGEALRKYPRASASLKQGVDREQKRVRC